MQSRLPSWGFGAEGESQLLFVPFKTEMQLDRPQEEAGLGSKASSSSARPRKGPSVPGAAECLTPPLVSRRNSVAAVDLAVSKEVDTFHPHKQARLYGIATALSQCPPGNAPRGEGAPPLAAHCAASRSPAHGRGDTALPSGSSLSRGRAR